MKLLRSEMAALVELAESPNEFETPEGFIEAMVKKLDEVRGERVVQFALMKVGEFWTVAGPFSTGNQARKSIEKAGIASQGYAVPGRTAEGWNRHLAELEAPAAPSKDFALVREDELKFKAKRQQRGSW